LPDRQRRSRRNAAGSDRTRDWPASRPQEVTGIDGTDIRPDSKPAPEVVARLHEQLQARGREAVPIVDASQAPGNVPGDHVTQSQPQQDSHCSAGSGTGFVDELPYGDAPVPPCGAPVEGGDHPTSILPTDDPEGTPCDALPYTPLHLLDLPSSISVCLTDHGIWSAQELCALSARELIEASGIDRDALTELRYRLWVKCLWLRREVDEQASNTELTVADVDDDLAHISDALEPTLIGAQFGLGDDLAQPKRTLEPLGLSPRTCLALDDVGIRTVEQLGSMSPDQLLAFPGFDEAMVIHILAACIGWPFAEIAEGRLSHFLSVRILGRYASLRRDSKY